MKVGSLCSGYGGLDLGLELALGEPLEHAWHVEYDRWSAAVLAHRFPGVSNHGDLTTLDPHDLLEPLDWLTAGYPCQPFSHAGKRKGSSDERHLWPYVLSVISVVRPRRVLLENVRGHVSLGLASVITDLARVGYVGRWGVVRASDAGAPHGRARAFVVATDPDSLRHERDGSARDQRPGPSDHRQSPPDPDSNGQQGVGRLFNVGRDADGRGGSDVIWGAYEPAIRRWELVLGRAAPRPTQPAARGGERLSPAFVEWMLGLPAGWVTAVPGVPRNAQLKALGNGVVPQQAALALAMLGVGQTSSPPSTTYRLLPTPDATVSNDGEGVDGWLARRERVKARGINGNGMGTPLSIAVRLPR